MGHRLVERSEPGKPMIGLLEPRRVFYEREARAFAAELLMPFAEVRRRWFAIAQERPVEGELSLEARVKRIAEEFGVTPAAMRVRLSADEAHPRAYGLMVSVYPRAQTFAIHLFDSRFWFRCDIVGM